MLCLHSPQDIAALLDELAQKCRHDAIRLLSSCFSALTPEEAGRHLGLGPKDATSLLVDRMGWHFNAVDNALRPPVISSHSNIPVGEAGLEGLTRALGLISSHWTESDASAGHGDDAEGK